MYPPADGSACGPYCVGWDPNDSWRFGSPEPEPPKGEDTGGNIPLARYREALPHKIGSGGFDASAEDRTNRTGHSRAWARSRSDHDIGRGGSPTSA
ncbi:hypothetical protein Acsp06_05420 [Actinomycetospora sp. NBRC 106375]|nr:hypothetical protein Acsp06_05420 [Actinomycetospora sp. NBRC 106375]